MRLCQAYTNIRETARQPYYSLYQLKAQGQYFTCIYLAYANYIHSAAQPPQITIRSPPHHLHAARAVGLLYIYPIYTLLIFSTGSRKTIGRYCSSSKSSGKFSSFYYIYYTYTLYKLLLPRVEPTAYPISLVKPQHILGLHTIYVICNIHSQSLGGVQQIDRLGIYLTQGAGLQAHIN